MHTDFAKRSIFLYTETQNGRFEAVWRPFELIGQIYGFSLQENFIICIVMPFLLHWNGLEAISANILSWKIQDSLLFAHQNLWRICIYFAILSVLKVIEVSFNSHISEDFAIDIVVCIFNMIWRISTNIPHFAHILLCKAKLKIV